MSKLTRYCLFTALAAGMSLGFSARAEVLVYDGFASSAYTITSGKTGTLSSYPEVNNDTMIGFSETTWQMNGSQPKVWGFGLNFPSTFAAAGITAKGEWSIGPNGGDSNSANRNASRDFVSGVGDRLATGTFYVRTLMHLDKTGASEMKNTSDMLIEASGSDANYYGIGLSPTTGTSYNLISAGKGVIAFFFRKNKAGEVDLIVRVKSADGATLVERELCDIPIETTGLNDSNTYIAYARVDVNAGLNGEEVVYAGAQCITSYSATATGDALSTELGRCDFITDTVKPQCLVFDGCYQSKGKVFMDEVGIATTDTELLAVQYSTAAKLDESQMSRVAGLYTVSAKVIRGAATDSGALAFDGEDYKVYSAGPTAADDYFSKEVSLPSPANDTTYQILAYAKNSDGGQTNALGHAYNGILTLERVKDADEYGLSAGEVLVSRANADPFPLDVVYAFASDGGTGGTTWENPVGPVTIPAGETSATIYLRPKLDVDVAEDIDVTVSLETGNYLAGTTPVVLLLKTVSPPAGYNTWMAMSDGLASEAANWSAGRAPIAEDNILFDGNFSNFGCSWDADATSTVASWTQRNGFTGIVTVETKYPEAANATFTKLTVTGDMVIDYGMLTQVSNDVQKEEYRLNVGIGGNLTIGSAGSIDVTGRGPRGVMSGRSANVYAGDQNTYQKTYGDPKRPYYCGSGNNGAWPTNYKGAGGGAAWIEVAGTAVVKGKILSEGSVLNSNMESFDGKNGNISTSGGSIYLKAGALVGDGSGLISAKSEFSCNQNNQIGSGGRVAIELTETAYDFESGGVAIKANANAKQAGSPGHGTIVIKNPGEANGTLFVLGKHDRNFSYNNCEYTYKQTTAIPNGDTWTFDKVVVGDFGMITVGEGSTLSLPNGWASVYAKNKSTDALKKYACGIILRGGTLDVPAIGGKHEFKNGEWTFHPTGGFVLDADTEISGRANVGAMYLSSGTNTVMTCDVKVQGSLDVKSDGYMNAVYGGVGGTATYAGEAYVPFHKNTVAFGTGHGGQNSHIGVQNLTYGSFFTPTLPGTPSGHADCRYVGGGVIMLEVTGALNVDGKIQSCSGWNGQYWNDRPSAPGSINITAAQLAGSGSICADGAAGYVGTYPKTSWETQGPAGGGRVAVRLTGAGAAMPDSLLAKITAKGATSSGALKSDTADASVRYSSAGSVYLQIAAEGEKKGTIIIRNDGVAENTAYTSLPAAAETDEITDFKDAKLELLDCGKVRLYDTLAMSKLTMSVDTKLDLNGNTLTVKSAKLGDATLAAGTYAASDYSDYLTDSVGGGSLVVTGSAKRGMVIIYR